MTSVVFWSRRFLFHRGRFSIRLSECTSRNFITTNSWCTKRKRKKKEISLWINPMAWSGESSPWLHLRKLKPNCSFTPSALPLGASLKEPSFPERTPFLISLQAKFNFLARPFVLLLRHLASLLHWKTLAP